MRWDQHNDVNKNWGPVKHFAVYYPFFEEND